MYTPIQLTARAWYTAIVFERINLLVVRHICLQLSNIQIILFTWHPTHALVPLNVGAHHAIYIIYGIIRMNKHTFLKGVYHQ